MASLPEFEQERLELASVLSSGVFARSPSVGLILNYVCSQYFEHGAHQIKEYNIAVEALGRPPEFDPRADSIVRVEAHKLRKRLREYYNTEGASHRIHIAVPPGQYAPRFLSMVPGETTEAAAGPSIEKKAPEGAEAVSGPPPAPLQRHAATGGIWVAAAVLALFGAGFPLLHLSRGHSRALSVAKVPAPSDADIVRIACGLEHGTYSDQAGNTWSSDTWSQGGGIVHDVSHRIRGTRDQRLYNSRREGLFRYDIPLKPGTYELRLHFAEVMYGANNPAGGGESSRVFGIAINGRAAIPNFDILADTEPGTADVKVFKDISPAADGRLHLQFTPVSNMPVLSGIEITPGTPGRMRELRMVAQEHGYRDSEGRSWEPDRYAFGGTLVSRNHSVVAGTSDPDLYRGERFGNISYVIPVAEGRYRVALHFSEAWFGPAMPGGGSGAGSRMFDILCNGVAVRRKFDIFREAGGANRPVVVEIPAVTPNHQGKIVISLAPAENYACINAIEVVNESP
jgi:hypothetical protein